MPIYNNITAIGGHKMNENISTYLVLIASGFTGVMALIIGAAV